MAVKLFLPYKCLRCGHLQGFSFWGDGSVRKCIYHICPSAPPGPASPPQEYPQGSCAVQVEVGAILVRGSAHQGRQGPARLTVAPQNATPAEDTPEKVEP